MNINAKKVTRRLLAIAIYIIFQQYAIGATVFVPAQASGGFGKPGDGTALISAANVTKKGTVIIRYISGTISDSVAHAVGPRGATYNQGTGFQTPLQESSGTAFGVVRNQWALIGAFVPKSTTQLTGFSATDGSKAVNIIGIPPNALFFVGSYYTLDVPGPGTLYLGINDPGVADNSGGYTVTVLTP